MHHHERPDATSGILPQERGAVSEDPHHSYWFHWVLQIRPLLAGGGDPPVAVAQDTRGELPIMHPTHKGIEAIRRTVGQLSFFTYDQVEPYHLSDGDKIRVQTSISGGTTLYQHHDLKETSHLAPVTDVPRAEI